MATFFLSFAINLAVVGAVGAFLVLRDEWEEA